MSDISQDVNAYWSGLSEGDKRSLIRSVIKEFVYSTISPSALAELHSFRDSVSKEVVEKACAEILPDLVLSELRDRVEEIMHSANFKISVSMDFDSREMVEV